MNLINMIRKNTVTFNAMIIYMVIMIFLPKQISIIANIIPIRLLLSFLLIGVIMLDLIRKKIVLNKEYDIKIIIIYILFVLSLIISVFYSYNKAISIYTIFKFISYILLFFFLTRIKFSKQEYKTIHFVFLICIAMTGILGILFNIFNINTTTVGMQNFPGATTRVNTTFFNTIYYGIFLNMVFLIYVYNYFKTSETKKMILFYVISIILSISLVLTYTRSAALVFMGQFGLLMLILPKVFFSKKILILLLNIILVLSIVPAGYRLVGLSIYDGVKMLTANKVSIPGLEITDPSMASRSLFNKTGLKVFNDNKLHGVGIGTYMDYMKSKDFDAKYPEFQTTKTHPHSGSILLRAEAGIISFVLFIVFYLGILIKLFLSYWKNKKKDILISNINGIAFIVAAGAIIINEIAENYIYDSQMFSIFIILIAFVINYTNTYAKSKKLI